MLLEESSSIGKVFDGEHLVAEVRYVFELHQSSPHKGLPTVSTVVLKISGLPRPHPPRLTLHMSDGRKQDFDYSGSSCKALGLPY